MSFDLKLTTACDHLVYKELSLIDDSYRIIRLEKPLAISATIQVYATDNLIPGSMYNIVNEANPVDSNLSKIIYFKEKWRSPTDYFQVSYQTLVSYCAKCSGSKWLDDISFDIRGDLSELEDEYLLMQNVEKFVVTKINTNPFHTSLGTSLESLIGSRITSNQFLVAQIKTEINKTLSKFQSLQSQYRLTGRSISQGETLQSVESISVTQDINDPTIFNANVTVQAASGKTVQFTQVLKIRS